MYLDQGHSRNGILASLYLILLDTAQAFESTTLIFKQFAIHRWHSHVQSSCDEDEESALREFELLERQIERVWILLNSRQRPRVKVIIPTLIPFSLQSMNFLPQK